MQIREGKITAETSIQLSLDLRECRREQREFRREQCRPIATAPSCISGRSCPFAVTYAASFARRLACVRVCVLCVSVFVCVSLCIDYCYHGVGLAKRPTWEKTSVSAGRALLYQLCIVSCALASYTSFHAMRPPQCNAVHLVFFQAGSTLHSLHSRSRPREICHTLSHARCGCSPPPTPLRRHSQRKIQARWTRPTRL